MMIHQFKTIKSSIKKLIDTENRFGNNQRGRKLGDRWEKWMKRVNYGVIDGTETRGGDHFVGYSDVEL